MKDPVTILYVDDEPINLMLFETLFNKKYRVITAESGYRGLEILKEQPEIQVIISDMKMPGMSGLEFVQRASTLFPEILYYILTGYEITHDIQKSMQTGLITEYFQKPFNMDMIDESITRKLSVG
jgi:two-component system, response regulator, stage 0 sporulation protein F